MGAEPVRICLVGAGRAGLVHGRNFVQFIPDARLVAVVDAVEESRAAAARELGVECHFGSLTEALNAVEFDAVCIATPTYTHRDLAVEAARARKHIFCEKPMAISVEDALDIIKAVQRSGVFFQMGFMRRFDEEFLEARAHVESGRIGEVMFIRSTTRGPGLPPPWAWETAKSNGMLAEVNSHDFDTVRWLTGSEYRLVFARAKARKAREVLQKHRDFYDVAVVSVEMESEALGVVDGACPVEYGYDARVEVLGTEGVVTVGAIPQGTVVRCTKDGQVIAHAFRSWRDRHRSGYLEEDRHFVRCIRTGEPPRVTALDGLRALEAVLAARTSLLSGQPVEVSHSSLQPAEPAQGEPRPGGG
ncbi:MAG: Gfo/Idh/MocA family oxidoreductase [Bacillota bacterium]